MRRIVKTFIATDSDDNEYTIHVLQGKHDTSSMHNRTSVSDDAVKEMRTNIGRAVNYVGPGTYDVIDGTRTIRVTSTDPDAP